MKFEVKNRFTGDVQFTAEIDCDEIASVGVKLGLAVKWAVDARANLAGADLAGAYLARANLAGAYLARADLAGAYLARADLAGAYLARANLADANLAGAYLARADLAIDAGSPNGWFCVGWLRDGWLSVRVGCHDKRAHEGREYWAGKDDRREVLAALDYVEAVARLRGWAISAPEKKEPA